MATLYVASTETFVGKSALCAALLDQFQSRGYSISYMKPLSVSVAQTEEGALDEDAQLMRELFGLQEAPDRITPVLATTSLLEGVLRGQQPDYQAKVKAAYDSVSQGKQIVVLEGTNTWAEGALLGLSTDQVSDLLQAPVLLISRFRSISAVDPITSVRRYLGQRLLGVVLNQVSGSRLGYVNETVVPFFEQSGIPVIGVIPNDPEIEAPAVRDIVRQIDAQVVGEGDLDRRAENISVGAMGAESALRFFRRQPNKAVITGGDRPDLQLAALETSTSCLILTGNLRPVTAVLNRAAQRNVPILLTQNDTLSTIQQLEALMGKSRFGSGKRERFNQLVSEHVDTGRLIELLGLQPSR